MFVSMGYDFVKKAVPFTAGSKPTLKLNYGTEKEKEFLLFMNLVLLKNQLVLLEEFH